MATSFPKENMIQFTPRVGEEPEKHTLYVSVVAKDFDPGPVLMLQMEYPMKILTSQETKDFLAWLAKQGLLGREEQKGTENT